MHAVCTQAGHDARLLVVTHALLKEVCLASAARPELVSCCSLHYACTSAMSHARDPGNGRSDSKAAVRENSASQQRHQEHTGMSCQKKLHGSMEVKAGAHCRERSSIQSKGLGVL